MKLDKLTRKEVQRYCDPAVYQRGLDSYRSGRVHRRRKTARGCEAEVRGTTVYDVTIAERRGELIAVCTCPYSHNWEGYCKHIVAALLTWLEEPESFAATEDFRRNLNKKTKGELIEILSQIGEAYPEIAENFLGSGAQEFDAKAAVERAMAAFAPPDGCTSGELVRLLEPIAKRAEAALVRGDAETARRIYCELISGCLRVDEEYGSTEIFPGDLIYSYVQGYQEAVEAEPERERKRAVIFEEIAQMEQSELAEIEGVEFGEVRELLKEVEKE